MRVEVLVLPGCPNAAPAAAALRRALTDLGMAGTPVHTRVVHGEAGFGGSPTILLDGVDPFADGDTPSAPACRLYATGHGPSGVPDDGALREALRRAADRARR